ncbi:MAG TPA: hypothetical protein PLY88_09210 [Candidatus Omnitrophota bacterium]|nr:hypothetical protein [Candidatus Omnitrophota bacterium]
MLKKIFSLFLISVFSLPAIAAEAPVVKKQETLLYRDVYEQNVHAEAMNQLDLSRWGRKLFKKPLGSANINVFDEVPDSAFFVNRHAKSRLTSAQLARGYSETDGPDLSGALSVTKAKTEGLHVGFFIRDVKGDNYLVKFDGPDSLELATAAEVITSRFFYALGYNVPQYTVAFFSPEKIKAAEGATTRDKTGFKKPLTQEKLEEALMFVPQTDAGEYRVSASKILAGENKGYFSFSGRRKADPDDIVNHRDRREIRALAVFGAWLNNNDIRESNTLDMLAEENGKQVLKHYLIDFNGSIGSAHGGAKPPLFGHEYMFDFGETAKAFLTLGFWEKPWQKRWREAGEKSHSSAAVGYFDNRDFKPAEYKIQLPYEVFKRVTRADGFWASKQIMAFSDEDIRTLVSAGKFSSKEDADYVSKTLIERRDLIAKYWFSQSAPLDDFKAQRGKLTFKDLAVQSQFEKAETRNYQAVLLDAKGKKIKDLDVDASGVALEGVTADSVIEIRVNASPYVRVQVSADDVVSVRHQD